MNKQTFDKIGGLCADLRASVERDKKALSEMEKAMKGATTAPGQFDLCRSLIVLQRVEMGRREELAEKIERAFDEALGIADFS